ncbi:hypothetical protein BHM03_00023292 [Ensete ventricosum]|nr:hypothetical protein BHM03_00023292 [Ensete ventricosum]
MSTFSVKFETVTMLLLPDFSGREDCHITSVYLSAPASLPFPLCVHSPLQRGGMKCGLAWRMASLVHLVGFNLLLFLLLLLFVVCSAQMPGKSSYIVPLKVAFPEVVCIV